MSSSPDIPTEDSDLIGDIENDQETEDKSSSTTECTVSTNENEKEESPLLPVLKTIQSVNQLKIVLPKNLTPMMRIVKELKMKVKR